jgi:hypothetical protein
MTSSLSYRCLLALGAGGADKRDESPEDEDRPQAHAVQHQKPQERGPHGEKDACVPWRDKLGGIITTCGDGLALEFYLRTCLTPAHWVFRGPWEADGWLWQGTDHNTKCAVKVYWNQELVGSRDIDMQVGPVTRTRLKSHRHPSQVAA